MSSEFNDLALHLRIASAKPFTRDAAGPSVFCAHPQYNFLARDGERLRYCGLRVGSQSSEVQSDHAPAEMAVPGLGERSVAAFHVSASSRFVVAALLDGNIIWWDSARRVGSARELPPPGGAAASPHKKSPRKKAALARAMRRVFVSSDGASVVAFDRLCEFHLWDMRAPLALQRWSVLPIAVPFSEIGSCAWDADVAFGRPGRPLLTLHGASVSEQGRKENHGVLQLKTRLFHCFNDASAPHDAGESTSHERVKPRAIDLRMVPREEGVSSLAMRSDDPCNAMSLALVHSESRSQLFLLSAHTGEQCAWTQFLAPTPRAGERPAVRPPLISDACWAAHGLLICLVTHGGTLHVISRSARPVWVRPSGSLTPFLLEAPSSSGGDGGGASSSSFAPPTKGKKETKSKKKKKTKKAKCAAAAALGPGQPLRQRQPLDRKCLEFEAIRAAEALSDSDDDGALSEGGDARAAARAAAMRWTVEYSDASSSSSRDARLSISDGRSVWIVAFPSACARDGGGEDALARGAARTPATAAARSAARSAARRMQGVLADAMRALLRIESQSVDPTFACVATDESDNAHMRDVERSPLAAWRLAMASSLQFAGVPLAPALRDVVAERVADLVAAMADDRRVIGTFQKAIECTWLGCVRSAVGGLEKSARGGNADAMSDIYDRLPEALQLVKRVLQQLGVPGIGVRSAAAAQGGALGATGGAALRATAALHVLRSAEKALAPVGNPSTRGPGFVTQWLSLTRAARAEAKKGDPVRASVGRALLHFLATRDASASALRGLWDLAALAPSAGAGAADGAGAALTPQATLWRAHGCWCSADPVGALRLYVAAGAAGLPARMALHLVQYEPAKALGLFSKRRWAQLAVGAALEYGAPSEHRHAGIPASAAAWASAEEAAVGGSAAVAAAASAALAMAEARAARLLARAMTCWILRAPIVIATPPYADRDDADANAAAGARLDAPQLAALVAAGGEWTVRRASSLFFAAAVLARGVSDAEGRAAADGDAVDVEVAALWAGALARSSSGREEGGDERFPADLLHELSVAVQLGELTAACHARVVHGLVLRTLAHDGAEGGSGSRRVRFVGRLLLSQRSALRREEVVRAGTAALEIVLRRLCSAIATSGFRPLAGAPPRSAASAAGAAAGATPKFQSAILREIEGGMGGSGALRRRAAAGGGGDCVAERATAVLELISHVTPLKGVLQRLSVASGAALRTLARSLAAGAGGLPAAAGADAAAELADTEANGMVAMAVVVLWSLHARDSLASAAAAGAAAGRRSRGRSGGGEGAAALELVRWCARLAQVTPVAPFPRPAVIALLISLLTQTVALAPKATSEALDRYFSIDTLRCLPEGPGREALSRRFRRLRKAADLTVAARRAGRGSDGGVSGDGALEIGPPAAILTTALKMPSLSPAQRAVSEVGADETFKAFVRVLSGWCQRDPASVAAAHAAEALARGEPLQRARGARRPKLAREGAARGSAVGALNQSFDDGQWAELEAAWDDEEKEWAGRNRVWRKAQGLEASGSDGEAFDASGAAADTRSGDEDSDGREAAVVPGVAGGSPAARGASTKARRASSTSGGVASGEQGGGEQGGGEHGEQLGEVS